MLTLGGLIMLFACVFGVFAVTGGALGPLMHALPLEFVTIGGAALATFIAGNSMASVKHTMADFKKIVIGSTYRKDDYNELLCLLFALIKVAASKGAMGLEPHIERPQDSPIFQRFPKILANRRVTAMICDYLRMVGMNVDDPHQIEDIMAREIRKILNEQMHGAHTLQIMSDGLPALGIVAAVLGVIKTMASISKPPAILGQMIGEALTGTFLGVLLAYGVVGPFAVKLRAVVEEDSKYLEVIRAVLVAHLHGNPPQVSVEAGRKMVPNIHMPSFQELEEVIATVPAAA